MNNIRLEKQNVDDVNEEGLHVKDVAVDMESWILQVDTSSTTKR